MIRPSDRRPSDRHPSDRHPYVPRRPRPLSASTLLAAALLLPSAFGWSRPVQAQTSDVEARVDELMAEYNRSDAPGAVLGVVLDGELAFARAYGMASLEQGTRLTTESILDVGSVSKQMTAFAVALLAERGAIVLDADIRTYLPEIPDFGSTITVRHLVHHTSGLREIYNASSLAGYQSGDGIVQADAIRLTERMRELNFEPGTDYLYCNTGYMLLADIVGRASDMPFADFMEKEVFAPLGMANTTIMAERGQVIPGAAESYGPREETGGFRRIFDNSGIQGAGGVYTTVGDLARWMTNYRTAEVGGPSVIALMKQHGVLANGDTLPYAFGINVEEERGAEVISHGGSSAGYRAQLVYFPELDAGYIRQANRADFDGSVDEAVAELFFGDRLEPKPEESADGTDEAEDADPGDDAPDWTPSTSELRAYEGRFFSPELETVYTLVVEDGTLIAKHRRHPDFELFPVESDTFDADNFFGTARFERDDAGRVTGMRVSNGRVRDLLFSRMEG